MRLAGAVVLVGMASALVPAAEAQTTATCTGAEVIYVASPAHTPSQAVHDADQIRAAIRSDFPEASKLAEEFVVIAPAAAARVRLADTDWQAPATLASEGIADHFDGLAPTTGDGTDDALRLAIDTEAAGWTDAAEAQLLEELSAAERPVVVIALGRAQEAVGAVDAPVVFVGPPTSTGDAHTVRLALDPVARARSAADIVDEASTALWQSFRADVTAMTSQTSPIGALFALDEANDPWELRASHADTATDQGATAAGEFTDVPSLIELGTIVHSTVSAYLRPESEQRRATVGAIGDALAIATGCDLERAGSDLRTVLIEDPALDGTPIEIDADRRIEFQVPATATPDPTTAIAVAIRSTDGTCEIDGTLQVSRNQAELASRSLAPADCSIIGPTNLYDVQPAGIDEPARVTITPGAGVAVGGNGAATVSIWAFTPKESEELSAGRHESVLVVPGQRDRWVVPPGEHDIIIRPGSASCGSTLSLATEAQLHLTLHETSCDLVRITVNNPRLDGGELRLWQDDPDNLPQAYTIETAA